MPSIHIQAMLLLWDSFFFQRRAVFLGSLGNSWPCLNATRSWRVGPNLQPTLAPPASNKPLSHVANSRMSWSHPPALEPRVCACSHFQENRALCIWMNSLWNPFYCSRMDSEKMNTFSRYCSKKKRREKVGFWGKHIQINQELIPDASGVM